RPAAPLSCHRESAMSDRRFRLDLVALALLVAGLLVALCVLGQESPPPAGAYPAHGAANLLGPPGASLALSLHVALGVAVSLLLASWFVLVVLLLVKRTWLRWAVRLAGWLVLLLCAAVVAEMAGGRWPELPLPDRGGALGAWLALAVRDHLAPPA